MRNSSLNTVIAVPTDLYDRMQETMRGPELRDWCQKVGLLGDGQDFADKRQRGSQITVSAARTFILNYHRGEAAAASGEFDKTETTPRICKSGSTDTDWERFGPTRKSGRTPSSKQPGGNSPPWLRRNARLSRERKRGDWTFRRRRTQLRSPIGMAIYGEAC